jgi:hypothetical protein
MRELQVGNDIFARKQSIAFTVPVFVKLITADRIYAENSGNEHPGPEDPEGK